MTDAEWAKVEYQPPMGAIFRSSLAKRNTVTNANATG
jgi:hypothetical protein